ncbi:hypothetical protein SBC1_54900 (plasmid) [Caballeronia sp. SBC1]|nr:hypothetical protein SBC2_51490 [Caballeronia sp. SBC2]QIN65445.1 hypothetical protein SBC1_54900 [Caballeronia sp. SBC1]
MTKKLTRYNGNRYVLRKGRSFTDNAEKTKAGRAMLMRADMVIWESNGAVGGALNRSCRRGFRGIRNTRNPHARLFKFCSRTCVMGPCTR